MGIIVFRGGLREQRCGGFLLLVAVVQYLVCEAVCASQWHSLSGQGYDYARNWISDLGAPGRPAVFEGSAFVSPLHALMNSSLGSLAVLGLVAGLLLTGLLERSRLRLALRGLVLVLCAGVSLVALFPETTDLNIHNNGATLTVAADVLALTIGLRGTRIGVPRWAARGVLGFGVLGWTFGAMFAFDWVDSAVVERVADYAPMGACVVGALAALLTHRVAQPAPVIDLRDSAASAHTQAGDLVAVG